MKNKKTLLVSAAVFAVVVAVTVTYFAMRAPNAEGPPDAAVPTPAPTPELPTVTYAPMWGEIEPADGAVVRGADAWVRWSAPAAKGQVQWRKAGETDFRTVVAIDGDPLLARLAPLEVGGAYEYIVETRTGEETQRSGLRKFTAQAGLSFDPVTEQTVRRDYDQTVTLTLKNTSAEKVVVAARALVRFADLPADVVGPGSADQPAELAPGQSIALRLAVTAPDATRETYDIPVEAAGASAVAKVRIAPTKFKLSLKVVAEDPRTLAKTVEVRNDGDTLTNLSIRVVDPNHRDVRLNPGVDHAALGTGKALTLVTEPVLYLEFTGLKAELECRAAGQAERFPLEFVAPKGKRLIGLRGGSGTTTGGAGGFCTNNPNTCSIMPGGAGNGPAAGAGRIGGAGKDPSGVGAADGFPGDWRFALASRGGAYLPPWQEAAPRLLFPLLLVQKADEPKDAGGGTGFRPKTGECNASKHCADCTRRAKYLRDVFAGVDAAYNEAVAKYGVGSIVFTHSVPGALYVLREQVIARWNQLREECLDCDDIGYLPGEEPFPVLRSADPGPAKRPFPDAAKKVFGASAQAWTDSLEGLTATGVVVGAVLSSVPAPVAKPVRGVFVVANLAEAKAEKDLSDYYKKLAEDPPSPDYKEVVQPSVKPLPKIQGQGELEGLSREVLNARHWQVAYLQAFLASYERYQGARQARDVQAMTRQAEAMAAFADLARQAAQAAALSQAKRDSVLLTALEDATINLQKQSLGWKEAAIEFQRRLAAEGLPAEMREALAAADIPEAEVEAYRKRLEASAPEAAPVLIADWKAKRESTQQVRRSLAQRNRHVEWPEPPDVCALEQLQYLARNALAEASAAGAGVDGPDHSAAMHHALATVQVSPGLLEALQRRASFTRAHRGPFAAALAGDPIDSSDTAAGWHAGDRVCFVWHQQDKIAFAAFDPRGEVLMEPQLIGKGRWPRVTADGKRTAIAWDRGDGSFVRIHDGEKWGDEVPLTGKEAAIAFAPGGPLHAATSTGLWKLADKVFKPVQKAAYSQPALVIDAQGRPHVASRKDGKIVYGDVVVDDGERPTLALAADGTLHLAYLTKGSIRMRSRKGDAWAEAETVSAKNPSWPALATGSDGVRLTYLGAAEKGPDALWLLRLPSKQPLLMPSLAGNVTDVYFLLDFRLINARWDYRPHDVWVAVNDVVVGTFDNTIPEGRYLYKLNPYQVFTSTGAPVPNRVALRSWHMNGGHYVMASEYRLVTRTAWSEWFAFAAAEADARKALVSRPGLNQDQPDLAVLANGLNLSTQPPKDGVTNFAVTVANVGESASAPAQLAMFSGERRLVSVTIPALKPGERNVATLRLEGRVASVTFKLEQAKPDFDPTNDFLTLHLWDEGDPSLTKVPVARPGPGTTVGLDLRDWKQQGPKGNGNWVLSKDGKSVLQTINGDPTFYVSPDEYIDITLRGTLTVEANSDDDYIGFVLGYKSPLGKEDDPLDFLLFDWKSLAQDNCEEGFALARVKGKLAAEEGLWDRKESDRFKVLAKDYGDGKGWRYKKSYRFEVIYQKDRVRISIDGKLLFDVKGAFQSGRFGFYNYSQEGIRYSDFSVTQGKPAPAAGAGGVPPRDRK